MTLLHHKPPVENMITGQLMTGDVLDESILIALEAVERADFLPESLKGVAYVDEELQVAEGRYLMQPLVFARLLKYAAILPHETVLIVGALSGYSAAVISHLAQNIVALEENDALAATAKTLLSTYGNVHMAQGNLRTGVISHSPYDVIIIEGAVEEVTQQIIDQLREGGRIVTIDHVVDAKITGAGLGKLIEAKKINGKLYHTILHDASCSALLAFKKAAGFVF